MQSTRPPDENNPAPGLCSTALSFLAALLFGLASPKTSAQTIAFTQSNPLLPGNSFDAAFVGEPDDFADLPLPDGLEFPWDIEYNPAKDRFFVVGAGADDGTSPPERVFNFNNRGTIWSFNRDGSDPVQHASGLNRPLYLDVSSDGQTVYFAEQGEGQGSSFQDNGRIGRLDVATDAIETVVTAPVDGGPTGVYFDEATNTLLYQVNNRGSDIAMQQIRRVNNAAATDIAAGGDELFLENPAPPDGTLDDADEFTVVSAGRNVQVHDGFVYFTYRNGAFSPASEIRRIPLDFALATDDPESFETVVGPSIDSSRILDFEIAEGVLYFTDSDQNSVYQVDLGTNGLPTEQPVVIATGNGRFTSAPIGLAFVPERASFSAWADRIGLPQDARGPQDRLGPLQTPNILAYAFGVDPRNASGTDLPRITESEAAGAEGELRFRFRRNVSADDLTLKVQSRPDLTTGNWETVSDESAVVIDTRAENGNTVEIVEIQRDGTPPEKEFFRLEVSLE